MQHFTYNGITFNISDIVLLKYKSRILKYFITDILSKDNDYIVKFKSYDYDYITRTVKFEKIKKIYQKVFYI